MLRRLFVSGFSICFLCMLTGCNALQNDAKALKGRNKGITEATASIANNVLLLKEYPPLPSPAWHGDYIKLLKEKCNCGYQVIDAPKFSEELRDEVAGWNDTMKMELRRRFGDTIVEDLLQESQKLWQDRVRNSKKQ
jgi:hypothetical protein